MSTKETDLYTEIIWLKPSLLYVHLRGDAMSMQFLYMYSQYKWKMCLEYVYIHLSCLVLIICYTIIYSVSVKIFYSITKVILLFFKDWNDSIHVKAWCILVKL